MGRHRRTGEPPVDVAGLRWIDEYVGLTGGTQQATARAYVERLAAAVQEMSSSPVTCSPRRVSFDIDLTDQQSARVSADAGSLMVTAEVSDDVVGLIDAVGHRLPAHHGVEWAWKRSGDAAVWRVRLRGGAATGFVNRDARWIVDVADAWRAAGPRRSPVRA